MTMFKSSFNLVHVHIYKNNFEDKCSRTSMVSIFTICNYGNRDIIWINMI